MVDDVDDDTTELIVDWRESTTSAVGVEMAVQEVSDDNVPMAEAATDSIMN